MSDLYVIVRKAEDLDGNRVELRLSLSAEGAAALISRAARNKSGRAQDGPLVAEVAPEHRKQVRQAYENYRERQRRDREEYLREHPPIWRRT